MRTDLRDVYLEKETTIDGEPLEAISRLVSSHAYQDYIVYERQGSWSYAGGKLAEIWLDYEGAHLRAADMERTLPWNGEPLGQVRELLDHLPYRSWRAYGWGAFELSFAKEGDRDAIGQDRLLNLIIPRAEVVIAEGTATIRATDPTSATLVQTALLDWSVRHDFAPPRALDIQATGKDEYQAAVEQAIADIRSDFLAKVILSRTVPVTQELDFLGTYIAGRHANNPARSFLMSLGGLDALGFSPEIVVRVESDGVVLSQPLAGTRALTDDTARNAALRDELLSDPKEVFEHAISVKTACDELAWICEPGSLSVQEFMSVRQRGSVQHLASRVCGRIADGRHAWDAFPRRVPRGDRVGDTQGSRLQVHQDPRV
jgi:salicylate synthase